MLLKAHPLLIPAEQTLMLTPEATYPTPSHGKESTWLEMKHPKKGNNNKLFFLMLKEYCKFSKPYPGRLMKVYSPQLLLMPLHYPRDDLPPWPRRCWCTTKTLVSFFPRLNAPKLTAMRPLDYKIPTTLGSRPTTYQSFSTED